MGPDRGHLLSRLRNPYGNSPEKEELDGYQVNDEVIKYIATNIKSNIRELEGALNKLIPCSRRKKEIAIEMAEQELRDITLSDGKRGHPELIINTVASHFGIRPEDIKERNEIPRLSFPDRLPCISAGDRRYPLKVHRNHNGEKDHTTVIHACNTIVADMEKLNPHAIP
ncbi:MAG: helix-turn-helix domain-containing protein [Lachnospiraceae bacterium]